MSKTKPQPKRISYKALYEAVKQDYRTLSEVFENFKKDIPTLQEQERKELQDLLEIMVLTKEYKLLERTSPSGFPKETLMVYMTENFVPGKPSCVDSRTWTVRARDEQNSYSYTTQDFSEVWDVIRRFRRIGFELERCSQATQELYKERSALFAPRARIVQESEGQVETHEEGDYDGLALSPGPDGVPEGLRKHLTSSQLSLSIS